MDTYNLTNVHDNGRKKGRAPSGIQHHRRARSATRYPLVRDSGGGRSSAESNAACCQNGKADHTSHPVEGAAEKVERPEALAASPPTSPSCRD